MVMYSITPTANMSSAGEWGPPSITSGATNPASSLSQNEAKLLLVESCEQTWTQRMLILPVIAPKLCIGYLITKDVPRRIPTTSIQRITVYIIRYIYIYIYYTYTRM
jgi:hypothetical protein